MELNPDNHIHSADDVTSRILAQQRRPDECKQASLPLHAHRQFSIPTKGKDDKSNEWIANLGLDI